MPADGQTPHVNQCNQFIQQWPDLEGVQEREFLECFKALDQLIKPLSPISLGELLSGGQEPIDLLNTVRDNYQLDSVFSKIMRGPQAFENFDVSSGGLVHLKLDDQNVLCIPAVKIGNWNLQEVVISEAHSLLAHLGPWKTLAYLREQVWWKDMSKDIYSFCESCTTCKRSKPSNQKPYGLLNPLPVPTQPCINFIGLLPLSKDRNGAYDSITVVIDLLTAMVHLILSHTNYTAQQVAELVFSEVYKHHGLSRAIISD